MSASLCFPGLKLSRRTKHLFAALWVVALLSSTYARGQEGRDGPSAGESQEAAEAEGVGNGPPAESSASARPTVWDLTMQGGIFMIPIFGCSVIVVAFSIERLIGLRRSKVIPPALLAGLDEQTSQTNGLDPRVAYALCQKHPSTTAQILQAGLLKIGRPHAEVEKAMEDCGIREIATLFSNVRPLNACASIGPLLGLIGTVQGMIMAFIVTSTTAATGTAKAQELAHGIYTALVTTFAGLCVAIPAVLFAHYFEGRIERLVREIEEIMVEILAHLERFEGKARLKPQVRSRMGDELAPEAAKAVPPAAVPRA